MGSCVVGVGGQFCGIPYTINSLDTYTLRLDSGSVLEKNPYCWEARDKVKDFLCKTKEKEEKVKAFITLHTLPLTIN